MSFLSRVFVVLWLSALAVAQQAATTPATVVPTLVNFSGVVRDLNGKPLTGTVGVTFAIYKETQGGAALWLETQNVQADKSGSYSVMLGATSPQGLPADLFAAGDARWLGVRIEGQEEQPRVLLLSVPYAMKAADAQTLGGLPASAFALANAGTAVTKASVLTPAGKSASTSSVAPPPASSTVTTTGGTVHTLPFFTTATNIQSSIVSQAGTSSITVKGQLNVGQGEPSNGILNASPASGSHIGVSATGWNAPLNSNGLGSDAMHVTGGNQDPNGFNASGPNGTGAVITGGEGVIGGTGAIVNGGLGTNQGSPGGGTGLIVNGGADDDCCAGTAIEASGGNFGGVGVMIAAGAATEFESGPPGLMVTGGPGGGPPGNGGDAIDAVGGSGFGGANGNAGTFTGNVSVSGDLVVAGTKNFKIDHPLDPANKYLYHASLESSEVLNFYSGNVTLDPNGEATVQLPGWFQAINSDFRYQLTAIGAAAPNLHIGQEIQNNSFSIAGGSAGMKVSWQVTALRQDAWEKAHPMTVEVEKPQRERGYYINPELHGAPPEKSMMWAHNPQQMKRLQAMQAHASQKPAAARVKTAKAAQP